MDLFVLDKIILTFIAGMTPKMFFLVSLGGLFLTYSFLGVDNNSKRPKK